MNRVVNSTRIHPDQLALARQFTSVRLIGPPMSGKLLEHVCHLFNPEEVGIAMHLPFYLPKTLEGIARRARSDTA